MKTYYAVVCESTEQFERFIDWFRHTPEKRKEFIMCNIQIGNNFHGLRFRDVFIIGNFAGYELTRLQEQWLSHVYQQLSVQAKANGIQR